MNCALRDLAQLVGGELHGNGDTVVTGAAILRDATEGDVTLADHPRLTNQLRQSSAAAVIVDRQITPEQIPYIVVDDVHAAFAQIVAHLRPPYSQQSCGVSPAAHVSPSASIGGGSVICPGATVGDNVVMGTGCTIHPGVHILSGCRLGNDVTIFPNAVLYENTILGQRVIVHAAAVLGAYGFGYSTQDGRHQLSAQLGNVVVEDDVEIGAGTTIDRGTYGPTTIGAGTKIDNQVMIAHNCRIGKHNLICSQAGVAGSCSTGDYVVMAGQVGLRDHIHVGDRTMLGAKAGVMNDVPADSVYYGIPATPEREQLLKQAAWSKLPAMRKEFKALQKQFTQLKPDHHRDAA